MIKLNCLRLIKNVLMKLYLNVFNKDNNFTYSNYIKKLTQYAFQMFWLDIPRIRVEKCERIILQINLNVFSFLNLLKLQKREDNFGTERIH